MLRDYLIEQTTLFLQENGLHILYMTLGAIGIFVGILIIIKLVVKKIKKRIMDNSLTENDYAKKIAGLMWKLVFVSMMIFNILIVFAFLRLDVAIVMWSLSIAIGFAMQTTIKNMISGILLITNDKVKIGAFVDIMWSFNIRGTIEEINMRSTIVRMIDKRRVVIPNWALAETPVKTISEELLIRWELDINIARHVNVDQVKKLLIQTINQNNFVLDKEFTSNIITWFDKQWIQIKTFFYFNPQLWKSAFVIWSEIRIMLSKVFKKYGIKAPYRNLVLDIETN